MRVTNLTSNRSGREVANQFELTDDNGNTFFQSYRSIIAKIDKLGKVTLDPTYWNYSKTTSKYRSSFLGESTKETQKKIDSGEYTLANLN